MLRAFNAVRSAVCSPCAASIALLAMLLGGCSFEPPPITPIEGRVEDLETLLIELEARHADVYEKISRGRFRQHFVQLRGRIPSLDEYGFRVELARLLVRLEDGHTGVFPFDGGLATGRRYPIELFPSGQDWLVFAAPPELEEIIGASVVRFGDRSIAEVQEAIWPLIPRDNPFGPASMFSEYVTIPKLLTTLELADDPDELPITVRLGHGEERTVVLRAIAEETEVEWRLAQPANELPLWLRQRDTPYWFHHLEREGILYLQFNSADVGRGEPEEAFKRFCEDVVRFIREHEVDKLVVDLRWNDGGNFWRTRHLLNALIRSERVNQNGKLFTVVGPYTYSAAVLHCVRLEQYTRTLFVGEPTGGRPNHSGELRRLRLPHTGIEVRYSAVDHTYSDPRDHRPSIQPQIATPLTPEAYRTGVDPALEAIRSYSPKQPLIDLLAGLVAEQGTSGAIERYHELKRDAFNHYAFDESVLNELGYRLLGEGETEDALELLQLNAAEYAYSANVYDSLADVLSAAGRYREAIDNYRRAFELDKRFAHVRDRVAELSAKLRK